MSDMTTKEAASALRKAARVVDLAVRLRPSQTAGEMCRRIAEALSSIEDAQRVLRHDVCWRERAEADCASVAQR